MGMPQPTASPDAPTTADKIRAAAAALFVARNYADVTIDQVADAARVTKGAVYHHFTSKEGLYLDTLLRDLARKRQLHEAAADGPGSCRDRLRALTAAFLALPDAERKLAQLVRRDANTFAADARAKLVEAYQAAIPDPIERILRDGIAAGEIIPGDPRLLAWQFVAMVEVVLTDYAAGRFARDEDRLNYVLSLFFRGCEWTARGGNE
jgi:AcrR family transcriptional regulator